MALGDVIARLAVSLSLDTIAFEKGSTAAQKQMAQMQRKFAKIGKEIGGIGKTMSLAITAPVVGAGAAVVKMTGDFEAAMNRVSISTQGSAAEMKAMSDLALKLGKDTTFGASDAADAMDMLAKNGVAARDILNGAADAAVNLAMAGGADLAPAADAITDVMQQFKLATADLPAVVDQITGAVNESKLDFEDFALAIGQAGGVAGASGVSFEDFNAAIAGTSSLFASGSDAGTSFKTFLLALPGNSKKAGATIEELGLKFYDAQGNMRGLGEIAEELRTKLAGLSDIQKTQALKDIFGNDAFRTAIGLMDQGAAGLDTIKAKIAETDAAAQSAKRLEGFNGQMENLSGAVETLAIRIGQSGLIDALTKVIGKLSDWIDKLAETNPQILKWGTIIAGVVAVIGPLLIGVGAMVSAVGTLLPLIKALGPVLTVAQVAFGALRYAMLAIVANPWVLGAAALIGGIYLAWKNWDKITAIVRDLYIGVKAWLQDKMGAVFNWVKGKLEAVGGWFYELYDKVVGHSYIPDMVDRIGDHMQRLDTLMVDKAQQATRKTAEAFRGLAGQVRALMDRLFPEFARLNAMRDDLATLESGKAAGLVPAGIDEEAFRRARRLGAGLDLSGPKAAVSEELLNAPSLIEGMDDVGKALKALGDKTKVQTVRIADSFKDMVDKSLSAIDGLVSAIKGGGFLDILRSAVGLFLQLGSTGLFGKGIAKNINSVPGYASGTSFHPGGLAMVGERGPELVDLPRGSRVFTNSESRGMMGGRTVVEIVDTTGLFVTRVNGQIQQAAPGIAKAGAVGALRMASRRQSRRVG